MFYIFLIAVLNLGLGFAAAMKLGRRYNGLAAVSVSPDSAASTVYSEDDTAEDAIDSSTDIGMDKDPDNLDSNTSDDDAVDGDSEEPNGKPHNNEPDEFEADLDELLEDIDI